MYRYKYIRRGFRSKVKRWSPLRLNKLKSKVPNADKGTKLRKFVGFFIYKGSKIFLLMNRGKKLFKSLKNFVFVSVFVKKIFIYKTWIHWEFYFTKNFTKYFNSLTIRPFLTSWWHLFKNKNSIIFCINF